MGPKIQAAINFVLRSSKPNVWAAIGDLNDAAAIVEQQAGTFIRKSVGEEGVVWYPSVPVDVDAPTEAKKGLGGSDAATAR
jgi:hypothetical protein